MLKIYDECLKRGKYDALNKLFDFTKVNSQWLFTEDKQLYHQQVKSKGKVGYSIGKVVNKETIHPLKRQKLTAESASASKLTYYNHQAWSGKPCDRTLILTTHTIFSCDNLPTAS